MINNIIGKYLAGNKRLVVPNFGAFIRKDGGEVVFVEFLKKDDGVLVSVVAREYALDETEAKAAIEDFILGVRKAVGTSGGYVIENIGTIGTDANGLLALEYDPSVKKAAVTADRDIPATAPEKAETKPEPKMVVETILPSADKTDSHGQDNGHRADKAVEIVELRKETPLSKQNGHPTKPADEPVLKYGEAKAGQNSKTSINDLYKERVPAVDLAVQGRNENRVPERAEPAPERSSRPTPETAKPKPRAAANVQDEPKRAAPKNYRKKSKADIVVIIAIIAAILAVLSMIFGKLVGGDSDIRDHVVPTQEAVQTMDPVDGQTTAEPSEVQ